MKTKILTFLTVFLITNAVYCQQQIDTMKLTDWTVPYPSYVLNDTIYDVSDAYINIQLPDMNVDSFIFEFTAIPQDSVRFYVMIADSNWIPLINDFMFNIHDTMNIKCKFQIPNNYLSSFYIGIERLYSNQFNASNLQLIIYKNTNSIKNIISKTVNSSIIGIYDLMGKQIIEPEKNVVYIYQYSDGTTEKRVAFE